ncbi:MAG: ADP-ribosylglycohydrolase family protein, partial [Bacteroidota bacterium]|nr:ADP-ribosylglycohydrolase family protein [Bacteroidota bacterium]
NWPYDFTKSLNKMKAVNGAFSDDDTDVEYLYLLMMEKYGVDLTYEQIREGWMYHIRDRVWLANRAALGLMHHGFTPPFTGRKDINPHWFQIDPQLINEIWGYTAPGMVKYATAKSDWAAHITSDSWATSPTILYGAMYSEAFFESDIRKLIEHGLNYLPKNDRYAHTVRDMLALYDKYPNDWIAARKAMAEKYYVQEPEMTKTIWNANLNGACGILALLYGHGDIQRTLNLGCAIGFDCDNQTATVNGILGIIHGTKAIPASLSMPFKGWTKPFNDRYINVTRYDMPDASIDDMINRIETVAVKIVCENGGKVIEEQGKKYLVIHTDAIYTPPMEFCIGPMPRMEIGKPVDYSFSCPANEQYTWSLKQGQLPKGVTFKNGRLTGTPLESGKFNIILTLSDGRKTLEKPFELLVRTNNIAMTADTIYANVREVNKSVLDSCWTTFGKPMYAKHVNVINDGILQGEGSVFYSIASKSNLPKVDYFGYGWKEKKTINMLAFHYGCMEEFGGWFSSINIQYLDEKGHWANVGHITSTPAFPESDTVFYQPHFVEFVFEFPAVTTNGIRLIGDTKVQDHWHKYTKNVSAFTSVTEVSVYEKK